MQLTRLVLASVVLLASACGESDPPIDPTAGPTVTLVDSVVLANADSFAAAAGGANAAVRSAAGELFLRARDQILRFGPAGEFVGVIGTVGDGPGELRWIEGMSVLPGDSLLAVVNASRPSIVLFTTRDHSVSRELQPSEVFGATHLWTVIGDTVLIPTVLGGRSAFMRWVLGSDSVAPWGELPPASMDGASRSYIFGGELSAAPASSGVLAFAPMHNNLLRYSHTGRITGGINLPRHRRRPIPSDAEEQVRELIGRRPPEFDFVAPWVMGVHQLPNGGYVTVHFDAQVESTSDPTRLDYHEPHYWISIVSADLSRACVDGEIPDPPEAAVRPIFHGDTVSFLVSEVPDEGEPRSVLRSYLVSEEGCAWVGTGAG